MQSTPTGPSGPTGPGDTPPGQAKKGYEYQVYYSGSHEHHNPEFIAKMNEVGADGWLLVAVSGLYLYFVRELK